MENPSISTVASIKMALGNIARRLETKDYTIDQYTEILNLVFELDKVTRQ